MGWRRGVATRDEPTGAIRDDVDTAGRNRCRRIDLQRRLVNSYRVEPDNSTIVVANRGRLVLVRLHMAVRDARMVGRIRLMDVLRRADHRTQQRDGGQDVKGGATGAEHTAIMVANRRTVKPVEDRCERNFDRRATLEGQADSAVDHTTIQWGPPIHGPAAVA